MAAASSASAGFWPTKAAPDARRVLGRWPPNATHLETEAPMIAEADVAATFRRLHHEPEPLVLANAWDAGSARLIESLGTKAIATTSAGVAWSRGYPDGNSLPVPLLVAAVAEISRAIRVPLTVDVEGGYAADPTAVGETIVHVIDAGAVGINIEEIGRAHV